ncbi:hypothetical protein GUJ93_ZPchr0006g42921 [Zizania palustris]|uniref:Uncharacterized protein n=1 Tax=Zizania palustris TaxID=103762 RepID=A0A8J5SVQ5_ZIZPA|nr:hypothetical protein GUJ93_ZPchr0006g42921 [Zizania palustris]
MVAASPGIGFILSLSEEPGTPREWSRGSRRRAAVKRRGEWKKGMWWEGEDGEEAARPREEVPVDCDFIALLYKPKVGIAIPARLLLRFARRNFFPFSVVHF